MPILRTEIAIHRRDYNAYPIRNNSASELPSGAPEDNYFLHSLEYPDFSVPIDPTWPQFVRENRLPGFNADEYITRDAEAQLDVLLSESPHGAHVNISNARVQYEYLRDSLHQG